MKRKEWSNYTINKIKKEYRSMKEYLNTYAKWHNGEEKLIKEISEKERIPLCKMDSRHSNFLRTVYNKESGFWECPHPDCTQRISTNTMVPPPR